MLLMVNFLHVIKTAYFTGNIDIWQIYKHTQTKDMYTGGDKIIQSCYLDSVYEIS